MTDREERGEHIKRLEAALACEEKQSSGKCSKQTCDDNCALLYEQGNWGEWKETLRYAINSLKIDLKYDLLYEETSGQADKQADKPTTKNGLAHNLCDSCTNIGCEFQSGIVRTKCAFYMPPHLEPDNCGNYVIQEPTTKNDLAVSSELAKNSQKLEKDFGELDCISRQATVKRLCNLAEFMNEHKEESGAPYIMAALFIQDNKTEFPPVTPQEPRWISCSEKLPEYGEEVLTCSNGGFIEIQSLESGCDGYWENQKGDWSDLDEIIAWMPLPTPYEPQESEKV